MAQKQQKTLLVSLLAVFAAVAVASTTALGVVWSKVCEFDRKNGCDVLAGKVVVAKPEEKAKACATNAPAATAAKEAKPSEEEKKPSEAETNMPVAVSFALTNMDEKRGEVAITFSAAPKYDDLRRCVLFEPKVEGLSVSMCRSWRYPEYDYVYVVSFTSESFKFRQDYRVTVRKDLQFDDERRALDATKTATLRLPDHCPKVNLTHTGRYLPAMGSRAVMVNCVNVTNLNCATWYVLPENIVQLLAREEGQYAEWGSWHRWRQRISADSPATRELSRRPHRWVEKFCPKLNEWQPHVISLQKDHGVNAHGVYLLTVGIPPEKKPRGDDDDDDDDDEVWHDEYDLNDEDDAAKAEKQDKHRLVCVSDIGLSVREDSQGLRAWATSLSTGKPLPKLVAKAYAVNGQVLAEKETDASGEAVLRGWDPQTKPFALVVSRRDRSDFTFVAIQNSMRIDEPLPIGERPNYLKPEQCKAFVWTDRGIYRHGEKIMTHVILRNGEGNAPKPFPVTVRFEDVNDKEVDKVSAVCDKFGAVRVDSFFAPENLPSGIWKIKVLLPGAEEILLGEREVKIEEFVPPRMRVKLLNLPAPDAGVTNIGYKVAVEHLFGGPAKGVVAESLVAFTDAEFAPEAWKGYRFGNEKLGLSPNYTRLDGVETDDKGEASFHVGMEPEHGEPKAAVRLIVQGAAYGSAGRPAVTRESCVIHKYPHYIGSNVPRYIRQKRGFETFSVVQVNPDGSACKTARKLHAELWKVETVYNLVKSNESGSEYAWDSQRVRRPVEIDETVQVGEDGTGKIRLPVSGSGDYELVVKDEELGVSFGTTFWISSNGDDEVRAALNNPTAVAISADKSLYREGERPRLTLKCPFRGYAWLAVMRDKTLYTRVLNVTNVTSVVELAPVDGAWAPNVDVAVSLVQAVKPGQSHLASRAHGIASLRIRTRDSELPVKIVPSVRCADRGGSEVRVRVEAKGDGSVGERAVITVVDEGINLLTNEKIPNPIGHLSIQRGARHPLYDLYGRLLPVLEEELKARGAKTGGDDLAGMMNRVSMVPSRRFRPLSQWRFGVVLTNGVGEALFTLPEFSGEVRITALAYNRRGTGCAAVHQKVSPKLVMSPDAPRFAAPGDTFDVTLSLFNRSGKAGPGEIEYEVLSDGIVALPAVTKGKVTVADGDSKTLRFRAEAKAVGSGRLSFRTSGLGETHADEFELPVRPAVAWQEQAEVVALRPGETYVSTNAAGSAAAAPFTRRSLAVSGSPISELRAAYDYLSEYPYGCLEQTTSRVFPLLYGIGQKGNDIDVVRAGVTRVVSMLRSSGFTMWPDSNCEPWDDEVSLYAAHFLVEAGQRRGLAVKSDVSKHVCKLLKHWAYAKDTNVAAYACHTLALAGRPEKDRTYVLYGLRDRLPLLSRTRLARAFVRMGEPRLARELVADAALDPKDVREAAFALLTLLEMDSKDSRLANLVLYLQKHRDRRRNHWGTTRDNAHALLALGAYYRAVGVREGAAEVVVREGAAESRLAVGARKVCRGGAEIAVRNCGKGDAYLSLKQLSLPEAGEVTNRHHLVRVSRRFKTCDGCDADMANLKRGDLLVCEISLSADRNYDFKDLVIQELLPACFETEHPEVAKRYGAVFGGDERDEPWILRNDVRDDRILTFTRPFSIDLNSTEGLSRAVFYYAVRVSSPGEFVLPGTSVEAMYAPEISAHIAPERLCVKP